MLQLVSPTTRTGLLLISMLHVRFEDFVLRQEATLERLEAFLGFRLGRIIVRPDAVGRWKKDGEQHYFDFFKEAMLENGYTEGLE